ncbi:MAG: fused MFS/spermidine synthase, partial [Acetobacteraceae bacterium]|nr:fused MFS/spermidine synthase [Acetobacteraceae bacterium]
AVGLGAGVMACYAGPDLRMTFQEISPAVIASARRDFAFLARCGEPAVELGDGRLLLAARAAASLDLIVLDAYSGGAVPVHTATVEAIGAYLDRLRPGGALGFHVSNAIFDLAPFIAAAAAPHGAGAVLLEGVFGNTPSAWVAVSRDAALLARLRAEGWVAVDPAGRRPWRDDFSDLLRALRLWERVGLR